MNEAASEIFIILDMRTAQPLFQAVDCSQRTLSMGFVDMAFHSRFAAVGFSSQKLLLDLMVRFTRSLLVELTTVKQRAITTVE